MISRVSMLILLQPDIAKAIEFYKKLGIPLKFQLPDAWAEFTLPDGIKLCLCPTAQPIGEKRTGIVFEVPDVKAFYNQFKDEIAFVGEPVEKVHGVMVGIKDPGGNIIDIYQPTPEKVKALAEKAKNEA